jgi:hypothetical protein
LLCRLVGTCALLATLIGCDTAGDTPQGAARPPAPSARVRATPAPPDLSPIATTRTPAAEWTILVYLDGDNNLEPEALADFREMASVGSTQAVNIVVQMDRIASKEEWDATSYGNWKTVKRFHIERGQTPSVKNAVADLGERNMGDPKTLADFITWGITHYPAKRTALIFWDHGSSWPGVASDTTSDDDLLTLPELRSALGDAQRRTGLASLDLIGFDACLMSQVDVLATIAPFAKVAIGSADLVPGDGWAWNVWLDHLVKKPEQTATEIAPEIVRSFIQFYRQEKEPTVTIAAYDLTRIRQLTASFDTLASALIADLPSSRSAIRRALTYTNRYAPDDDDLSTIDLGSFAQLLIDQKAGRQTMDAAKTVLQTLREARIAEGHGRAHPKTSGISIYFPRKSGLYQTEYAVHSPIARDTHWPSFLQAFYKKGSTGVARSKMSRPAVSASSVVTATDITIQAQVEGADTAYVSYFAGAIDRADPSTIRVVVDDYVYPPGTQPGEEAPVWGTDTTNVAVAWSGNIWRLGNGRRQVDVSIKPAKYGTSIYNVHGRYRSRKTGQTEPVNLEFEIVQDRATLLHIWAFPQTSGAAPTPYELTPIAGDSFTPELALFHDTSDDQGRSADALTRTTANGRAIAVTAEPFQLLRSPAPAGSYLLGLAVENTAGVTTRQVMEVEVGAGSKR